MKNGAKNTSTQSTNMGCLPIPCPRPYTFFLPTRDSMIIIQTRSRRGSQRGRAKIKKEGTEWGHCTHSYVLSIYSINRAPFWVYPSPSIFVVRWLGSSSLYWCDDPLGVRCFGLCNFSVFKWKTGTMLRCQLTAYKAQPLKMILEFKDEQKISHKISLSIFGPLLNNFQKLANKSDHHLEYVHFNTKILSQDKIFFKNFRESRTGKKKPKNCN